MPKQHKCGAVVAGYNLGGGQRSRDGTACKRRASIVINKKELCYVHAGMEALALAINNKVAIPLPKKGLYDLVPVKKGKD